MAYRLAIENTVKFPVKFTLNNAGKTASYNFSLTADRLTQEEIKERMANKDGLISDFLKEVIKGWNGQTLVLGDDDKPAEFNEESLHIMLNTAGVSIEIFNTYLREAGAKGKN